MRDGGAGPGASGAEDDRAVPGVLVAVSVVRGLLCVFPQTVWAEVCVVEEHDPVLQELRHPSCSRCAGGCICCAGTVVCGSPNNMWLKCVRWESMTQYFGSLDN